MATDLRQQIIHAYIMSLVGSLGGVRPAVDERELRALYGQQQYTLMFAWVKEAMKLGMRLRVGYVNSGGPADAPAWVHLPERMPSYGSPAFNAMTIEVFVRRSFLSGATFEMAVWAIAHELAHIVLDATGNRLRRAEEAVDLAAMLFGFRDIMERAGHLCTPAIEALLDGELELPSLAALLAPGCGYLEEDEVRFAAEVMRRLAR
jgi:hypothetical protein